MGTMFDMNNQPGLVGARSSPSSASRPREAYQGPLLSSWSKWKSGDTWSLALTECIPRDAFSDFFPLLLTQTLSRRRSHVRLSVPGPEAHGLKQYGAQMIPVSQLRGARQQGGATLALSPPTSPRVCIQSTLSGPCTALLAVGREGLRHHDQDDRGGVADTAAACGDAGGSAR